MRTDGRATRTKSLILESDLEMEEELLMHVNEFVERWKGRKGLYHHDTSPSYTAASVFSHLCVLVGLNQTLLV